MDFLEICLHTSIRSIRRRIINVLLIALVAAFGAESISAAHGAETRISGVINHDHTWNIGGSPYILQGEVILDQGAVLTIESGTVIWMDSGASFTLRQGTLRGQGTASKPIVVTSSKANKAPGDWGEWKFLAGTKSPDSILENFRFEYGSGLVLQGASPVFNRVAVFNQAGPAIKSDLKSSPSGYGLEASGNAVNAILVTAGVISGQVTWGLTGIPYLVQNGLVEVGVGNQIRFDPMDIRVGAGDSALVKLILDEPASSGGTDIALSFSPIGYVDVPTQVSVPAGVKEVQFSVKGRAVGAGAMTASQTDLGTAQANFSVFELPSIGLQTSSTKVASQFLYSASLYLPNPAPSGGKTIQLMSEPSGSIDLPAEIIIAAGQQEAQFSFKAKLVGDLAILAKTSGYKDATSNIASGVMALGLDESKLQQFIVSGTARATSLLLSHPAPTGGLAVNVAVSDATVATPQVELVAIPAGAYVLTDGIQVRALSEGRTTLQVSADGAKGASAVVNVQDPIELRFARSWNIDQSVLLGAGLLDKDSIVVQRTKYGELLVENKPLKIALRCIAGNICKTPPDVTIPAGGSTVVVPVEGISAGATRIEATAIDAKPDFLTVVVENPTAKINADRYPHYVGDDYEFSVCWGTSDNVSANMQTSVKENIFDIALFDLIPEDVAGYIKNIESGNRVSRVNIPAGERCVYGLAVKSTSRGKYRIRATSSAGENFDSEFFVVSPDRGLEFDSCGDGCRDISVAKGMRGKFSIRTTNRGNSEPTPEELTVQLRCANPSICAVQEEVKIPANTGAWGDGPSIELSATEIGDTVVEARVVSHPNIYPEVYTASVKVESGEIYFPEWKPNFKVASAPRALEVCLSSWRSFPATNMNIRVQSSNPAIVSPVNEFHNWPARETCTVFDLTVKAIGSTELTVVVPGFASAKLDVEVQE